MAIGFIHRQKIKAFGVGALRRPIGLRRSCSDVRSFALLALSLRCYVYMARESNSTNTATIDRVLQDNSGKYPAQRSSRERG